VDSLRRGWQKLYLSSIMDLSMVSHLELNNG